MSMHDIYYLARQPDFYQPDPVSGVTQDDLPQMHLVAPIEKAMACRSTRLISFHVSPC
jgi:hypothetical protein